MGTLSTLRAAYGSTRTRLVHRNAKFALRGPRAKRSATHKNPFAASPRQQNSQCDALGAVLEDSCPHAKGSGAQARPNGRITAPAGTPARWIKHKACKQLPVREGHRHVRRTGWPTACCASPPSAPTAGQHTSVYHLHAKGFGAQARPNGRMTAPAGTPARLIKHKACKIASWLRGAPTRTDDELPIARCASTPNTPTAGQHIPVEH